MSVPIFDRAVLLACLLLSGCAPSGFPSIKAWEQACIRQGGEPTMLKSSSSAPAFMCIKRDALVKVIP